MYDTAGIGGEVVLGRHDQALHRAAIVGGMLEIQKGL
jgi:hypothetical protein